MSGAETPLGAGAGPGAGAGAGSPSATDALVISGGGSNGDFHVGALQWLSEHAEALDFRPTVLSTVSVGSILGSKLAERPIFEPEVFRSQVEEVVRIWETRVVGTQSVWSWRDWSAVPWTLRWCKPFLPPKLARYVPGLFAPSFGDNAALEKLLTEELDFDDIRSSGVKFRLGGVDLPSGKIVRYTEQDVDVPAILASSSYPGAFPPVKRPGLWLTDEGVRNVTPLSAAIKAGATRLFVLVSRNPFEAPAKAENDLQTAPSVLLRVVDLLYQEVIRTDIEICHLTNDLVRSGHDRARDKREIEVHLLYPSRPLGDSLDFGRDKYEVQRRQGYSDASERFGDLLHRERVFP